MCIRDSDLRGPHARVITTCMPHRHGLRPFLFGVVVVVTGACEKDKLSGPEAEVTKSNVKMSLPQVPSFDLPPSNPDGSHSVKELRVKGKKLLDTDVVVKGYVTWAYDCATALREPGMDEAAVQKIIDDDPTKCERPKFYVGDCLLYTSDAADERSSVDLGGR